ncbi:MAG TPA: PspC domain-containing protein [Dehalococcoidales bacterium]|nr:PspC domain-containing protein [Dehalococcoidales bacterium]
MEKKLYRSRTDRMLLGVCGGLAKYFGMDSSIMRIISVLLTIATAGFGILVYLFMVIIVPLEGSQKSEPRDVVKENAEDIKTSAEEFAKKVEATFSAKDGESGSDVHFRRRYLLGIGVIVVGVIILLGVLGVYHIVWGVIWPVILIAVGVLILLSVTKKRKPE